MEQLTPDSFPHTSGSTIGMVETTSVTPSSELELNEKTDLNLSQVELAPPPKRTKRTRDSTASLTNVDDSGKSEKQLANKMREYEIHKKIVKNLVEFFGTLPQTSPLRQPLYRMATKDMTYESAKKVFNISSTTWKRIRKAELTPLLIKSLPNQTRRKVSDEDKEKFDEILNSLLPQSNSRNYRVQNKSTKDLYEDYKSICQARGIKCFSKSYFRRQLKKENIHHKKTQSKDSGDDESQGTTVSHVLTTEDGIHLLQPNITIQPLPTILQPLTAVAMGQALSLNQQMAFHSN